MKLRWEDGFTITVNTTPGEVTLTANRAGLRSLAGLCAALAEEAPGSHVHLDGYNSLEEGSAELIIALGEE